jgi:membrane-associated PAP2 superfamily phosphatase
MKRSPFPSWWWFAGLLAASALLELTPLDRRIQDLGYDFSAGRWRVDENAPAGRLLFYDGPKVVIGLAGAALLALAAGPARWRSSWAARGWHTGRRPVLTALVAAAAVPILVGFLKSISGVYCPAELTVYGGTAPYLRPFAYLWLDGVPAGGHCWPAGHPSGAFGLLALRPLAATDRHRRLVTVVALVLGGTMGLYQMLKGAHFLSHILVTLLLAALIATIAARLMPAKTLPAAGGT